MIPQSLEHILRFCFSCIISTTQVCTRPTLGFPSPPKALEATATPKDGDKPNQIAANAPQDEPMSNVFRRPILSLILAHIVPVRNSQKVKTEIKTPAQKGIWDWSTCPNDSIMKYTYGEMLVQAMASVVRRNPALISRWSVLLSAMLMGPEH